MFKILNKNKDSFFVFILFLLFFGFINYCLPIGTSYDEIWKYGVSKAISMGYIPYKDVNMNTTPFYFFFEAFFLGINDSLFTFRIVSTFMWSFIFLLIYKCLKKSVNGFYSIFVSSILFCLLCLYSIYSYVFCYNSLIFLFILFLEFILEKKEISNIDSFFVGIILSLGILTKQTSGVLLFIFVFIIFLIRNKNNLYRIFLLLLGFFIPNFIFLIYLLKNHIIFDFFDYCLFGLIEFSDKNVIGLGDFISSNYIYILFLLFVIFSLGFVIFKILKTKNLKHVRYLFFIIVLYSLCCPIMDFNHFIYLLFYCFIVFFDYFKCFFSEHIKGTKFFLLIYFYLFLVFVIFVSCNESNKKISNLNNFERLFIYEDLESYILDLDRYIKCNYNKEDVVIISSSGFFHSIINDSCNGIFDLFFYGNIGTKNHVDCIKEQLDNGKIICINNNYDTENWQNSKEIYPYIKNNCILIDTFNNFEFYKKIE